MGDKLEISEKQLLTARGEDLVPTPPRTLWVPCRRRNFDGSDMEPGQPYTGWELFLERPSCRLAVQVQVRPRPVNLIVEFLERKLGQVAHVAT